MRKAAAAQRREIAALKRTIAALDRGAKSLAKTVAAKNHGSAATDEKPTRFVAKGLVSLRKRLDLSVAGLARLLGVSMQSVYNWEHKKASPRKEQVAAIVALRALGKREAHQRLEAASRPTKRKAAKRGRSRA